MVGPDGRRAPWRPTRAQLEAARGRTVPDLIAPGLRVLFCGINPGLTSGAVGHHFAHPGNRFWKVLHAAGFTDRVLSPFEEAELLPLGLGVTNLVERTTAAAAELSAAELREGAERLAAKVRRHRPQVVAFLGLGAYRAAFGRRTAALGPQEEDIGGARVWLLPNPSGLQGHYGLAAMAEAFAEMASATTGRAAGGRG
jgi:double-stranded uracil-DNA glycosylase